MDFEIDAKEVIQNLEAFGPKFEAALNMYGDTASKKLEEKAKRNRPWTDRTTRARQGLTGTSDLNGSELHIVLAHTVDYGIWLELAHEKNWAIVEPTVRLDSNEIIQGLRSLVDQIKI